MTAALARMRRRERREQEAQSGVVQLEEDAEEVASSLSRTGAELAEVLVRAKAAYRAFEDAATKVTERSCLHLLQEHSS